MGEYKKKGGKGEKGGGGGGGYYEGIHNDINENFIGLNIDENFIGLIAGATRDESEINYNGRYSAVEISQNNIDNDIAKGGDGTPCAGGGGGGGGLASKGGNGGSGIVIIMLKTKEKKIEVESSEHTFLDIENMFLMKNSGLFDFLIKECNDTKIKIISCLDISKNNAYLCFSSKCSTISSNNKIGAMLNLIFSILACDSIIEIKINFCSPVEDISTFLLFFLFVISILEV